jgi:hypothetical protein
MSSLSAWRHGEVDHLEAAAADGAVEHGCR